MSNNKLTILNFSPGIKASDVNYNFSVIKDWIERERLRVGGWGICEGFEMSYDYNYNIIIDKGIFINELGEEVIIPKNTIKCGMPDYFTIQEKCVVSNDGIIELKYAPFSPNKAGIIKYLPPDFNDKNSLKDISIIEEMTDAELVIYSIVGSKISVDIRWAGRTVLINYIYCNDQIDAILVDKNGNYYREEGILSTSASKTNIDLSTYYIIGFARWIISETIDVEFITDDRTYRKVYVDNHNVLYLNGKPYKEAQIIYFVEPENPDENTLWYDRENNALCIWMEKDGVFGWVVINDFSDVPIKRIKMWSPEENNFPSDAQTFLFDDDEIDLRYIPNTNALDIVIDQYTLMNDQFEEIIQQGAKSYLSSGIGFRLNNPLDNETVVQCTVSHVVRNGALRNVFQRAAIFITENYDVYSSVNNIDKIFETNLEYCIGASQLEVWVDGVRLNKDVDFCELLPDRISVPSSNDNGTMTKYFMIIKDISDKQRVTHKISRYVWSYDQLNIMMEDIERKADEALIKCENLQQQINNMIINFNDKILTMQQTIQDMSNTLTSLPSYRETSDLIDITDLTNDVKDLLYKNNEILTFNAASGSLVLSNIKSTDVININYVSNNINRQLLNNTEYYINFDNINNIANISIVADLISSDATVIVNVIHFGR